MLRIVEVTNKALMKRFVNFVLDLYKDNPYYVPYIYGDEINMLNPKFNLTLKDCETAYFLCVENNEVVGRVGAILQRKYNQLSGEKCVRFTRFDCINSIEVARLLIGAVEDFALKRGKSKVSGPFGFNETDRAGYLIEGFEVSANFGTNYNYPYYDDLLKQCGYANSEEWVELQLKPTESAYNKFSRLSELCQKKYKLSVAREKTFGKFCKKYGWDAFQCLNEAYAHLPGFIPFEYELYEQIRKQFSVALRTKYMTAVINQQGKVAGFAVCFPSMAESMKQIKGKLFPFGFVKVLLSIKKPKILELCLIVVRPEYMNMGINAILIDNILRTIKAENIEVTEAYPQLVENEKTLSQWKHFDTQIIKRRRVVEKHLERTSIHG